MECRRGLSMKILSVCPSVRLTNVWIVTKWKTDLFRFLYYMKERLAQFSQKIGWWGATPFTWNFGSTRPHWSEIADFEPIFVHSVSAVTPSQKSSINTNRKSTTRFPMSLRWSSDVALKPPPPKGAQKRKTAVFLLKWYFAWRKSDTKFICVKTVSDKVVRLSLAYPCKMIGGRGGASPSTWNFRSNWQRWSEIADFQSIFARSASPATNSEKSSINTQGSVFLELSNELKMNIVRCPHGPQGAQKRKVSKM